LLNGKLTSISEEGVGQTGKRMQKHSKAFWGILIEHHQSLKEYYHKPINFFNPSIPLQL
jgi:hypothetical protein